MAAPVIPIPALGSPGLLHKKPQGFLREATRVADLPGSRTVVVFSMLCTDALYGQQREAEVANLGQQAVQCCLIGDQACDDGHTVGLGGDLHAVEPRGPALVEAVGDSDLVLHSRQLTAMCRRSRHPEESFGLASFVLGAPVWGFEVVAASSAVGAAQAGCPCRCELPPWGRRRG
jgi:hypothetical protein